MVSLQNGGSGGHIRQLAVGAGADNDLVDGDVFTLPGAVGILRQVGPGHGAVHLGEVYIDGARVLGVGVCLKGGPGRSTRPST